MAGREGMRIHSFSVLLFSGGAVFLDGSGLVAEEPAHHLETCSRCRFQATSQTHQSQPLGLDQMFVF